MASNELDIADDIEASDYFILAVLNNGVTLKVSEPLEQAEPSPRRNLFALSNLFGLAAVATDNGFAVYTLSALRQAYTSAKQRTQAAVEPLRSVAVGEGGLTFLKIAFADKVVIASGPALQGGVGVWRLKSLVDGTSSTPLHVFPAASSSPLIDVLPNPSDRPELLALLYQDGQIVMMNMETKSTVSTFGQGISAACWSVKGKQIVCGDINGNLTQYTPEGEAKTVTEAPPSLQGRGIKVLDIRWVENTVFFVTYCDPENPMMETAIIVSTRAKDGSVTYSPILDPLMVETMDRPEARFNAWMKNWTPFKHLLLVCNATSNTIGHVGLGPVGEDGSSTAWSSIKNDLYTTLPLETYPLGIDIDFTDTNIPPTDENLGDKPLPTLWSYASDGTLSAWRIVNRQGEEYSSIALPKDILTEEDAGMPTAAGTASAVKAQAAATGSSPFGASASPSGFGTSAFGSGSFASPPSFGRPPSFGAPPSFAPAFGQPTFGASPAFGKPAFGQSAASTASAPAKTAFSGFSSTQGSGFASASSTGNSSPFASGTASPSPTPAFASSQPASFGTSTFGQSSTPSGTVSMATSPAPAAFGQSSPFGPSNGTTSPFAAKPASTGFGAFASTSDSKPASSGFGAFSSSTGGTSSGFSFGTPSTDGTKNAFGVPQSSAFTGIRGESSTPAAPTIKPPGLDENDAEDMEPESTSNQKGGALDFDDENADDQEKRSKALSFGGLGFGGSNATPAANTAPSAFGSFAKSATPPTSAFGASATLTPSPFSFKPKDDNAASKPAFGFSSFSNPTSEETKNSESTKAESGSTPTKTSFSFAKPAQVPKEDGTEMKEASSASPFGGFGKSPATSSDNKETETSTSSSPFGSFGKPQTASSSPAFGQASAFGKPATFGQTSAFAQPTTFGQKPTFGTPSTSSDKPAFSFGKPTSETKVSGGFSSFASPAAGSTSSPFASPSATPSPAVSPAFGQPGLFGGVKKPSASPATPSKDEEASKEQSSQGSDTVEPARAPDTVNEELASKEVSHPVSDEEDAVSPEKEDVDQQEGVEDDAASETHVKQEEVSDEEVYNEDSEQVEGSQEGEEGEEGASEAEVSQSEPTDENDNGAGVDDSEEVSVPSASPSPEPSPSLSDASDSLPGSPSPAPVALKKAEASAADSGRSTFAPSKSAFSFAPSDADSKKTEPKAATPSWTFDAKPADQAKEQSASTPFAGFGQTSSTQSAMNAAPDAPKSSEAPKSAFTSSSQPSAPAFSFPSTKPADSPKPFGLGNLQKATPRTSSPLASMPSFAPPASPSQTQSSFDLSNLSSNTSSPSVSPTKAPQPLPVSTTPLARPPPRTVFKQAEQAQREPAPAFAPPSDPLPPVSSSLLRQKSDTPAMSPLPAPPKLSSSLPKEQRKPPVSQDAINIFLDMQGHLDALKESAAACMGYYHQLQPARIPREDISHPLDVLEYGGQWGMGDLPRLREVTRILSQTLAEVSQQAKDEEKAARSLEGSLLKTKAKAEEINRYFRAREDPQVAKMVRVRQLGPEQLENQNRIRRQTQNVNEAMDELERTILTLKAKVLEEKLGRSPLQAPSLDSIYRAIRNMTAGLQSKIAELDDVALRLEMANLSTSSPAKKDRTPKGIRPRITPSPANNGDSHQNPTERSFSRPHATKVQGGKVMSRVEKNVRRALAAEEFGQKLKDAWLANRTEPLLNTSANEREK